MRRIKLAIIATCTAIATATTITPGLRRGCGT